MKKFKKRAFTLSEVIITLVVLGIVAAITVPMMSNSASDKKWNVARQKAKATIGEAFRLMTVNGEISTTNADGTPRTTEYMVTKVLPKYLKLEKTCAPGSFKDCGFSATVKTPSGTTVGLAPNNYKWTELSEAQINRNGLKKYNSNYPVFDTSYYFRTIDGFSVAFLYNPYCATNNKDYYRYVEYVYMQAPLDTACFMGIYDMNGKKGPNKVGYDIGFIGSFYNAFDTQMAAVLPHSVRKKAGSSGATTGSASWDKLSNYCNNLGKDKEWIMPDINETVLILLNYRLVNNIKAEDFWSFSRTPAFGNNYYFANGVINYPERAARPKNHNINASGPWVRCVRRTQLK